MIFKNNLIKLWINLKKNQKISKARSNSKKMTMLKFYKIK